MMEETDGVLAFMMFLVLTAFLMIVCLFITLEWEAYKYFRQYFSMESAIAILYIPQAYIGLYILIKIDGE